eukprot:CAMPEP_0174842434 /NCGR_PEP_ID=MMETSP1114-20130205/9915_1 /TAXON_ID=312471 /ORGANISM="Neobodo designis, Strain CCAP 1951/1" /LENGTH=109 /DNA_ID=CAMNT_0016076637 /DNA_START=36 /DNA_END=362 /DNA_ORIENTATION=+
MAGEKRGIDLSAFPSDDDSSDGDAPTEQRPPLAKDSASFGAAYLAQFGWKKGQPIRPGGVTEEYKPRSEGGFASAGQAKVDTTRLVTGAAVARVQATGGGAPAVGTITR